MTRRILLCCLGTILLLGLSGCVRETTEGATHTFEYELWVSATILLAGLIAGPAGWFLRRTSDRLGWGLMIVSPLAAVLFAPTLFFERVVVDDTTFSGRG